jgi:hypothetical protein
MRPLLRLAGCAAFACLLFLGGCALAPDLLVNLGLDWWNWPQGLQQYDAASERDEELARQGPLALERIKAKDAIARELIAGRLSLAEAVARFRALPHPPRRMRELLRRYHGAGSDEEILRQHVLDWACLLLEGEPARAEALRRRLLAELEGR